MVWQADFFRGESKSAGAQISHYCIARDDGRWDYYPDGFSKPGFIIDESLRARLIAVRTHLTRVMIPIWVATIGLGFKGGGLLSGGFLAPFAASGVVRWCVVFLAGLAMVAISVPLQIRRRRKILEEALSASKTFSAEEARQMRYGGQQPTARLKRNFAVVLLTFCIGGSAVCAWFAWQHLGRNGDVSIVEAMLLATWSALLAAFPGLCAVGQLRSRLLASDRGR